MNKELAAKGYALLAEGYATLALAVQADQPAKEATQPVAVPKAPADRCVIHGLPWKVVPAGVSQRTGKPYSAFATCPEKGCKERPDQAWYDEHGMAA